MRQDLRNSRSKPLPSSRERVPSRGVECSSQGYVIVEMPFTGVALGVVDLWSGEPVWGFEVIDGEDTTNLRIQTGRARQNADDEESKSFPARIGTKVIVENADGSPGVDRISVRVSAASTATLTVVVYTRRPLCCMLHASVLRGSNGETISTTNPLPVNVIGTGGTADVRNADNDDDFAVALLGMIVNARLAILSSNTGNMDRLEGGNLLSTANNESRVAAYVAAGLHGYNSAAGAGSRAERIEAANFDADADIVSTLVGLLVNARMGVWDGTDWRRLETELTSPAQRLKVGTIPTGGFLFTTATPLGGGATYTSGTTVTTHNASGAQSSAFPAIIRISQVSAFAFADQAGTSNLQGDIAFTGTFRTISSVAVAASTVTRNPAGVADQELHGLGQFRTTYVNGGVAQGTFEYSGGGK